VNFANLPLLSPGEHNYAEMVSYLKNAELINFYQANQEQKYFCRDGQRSQTLGQTRCYDDINLNISTTAVGQRQLRS
jgi:hypothetical protein